MEEEVWCKNKKTRMLHPKQGSAKQTNPSSEGRQARDSEKSLLDFLFYKL